MNDYFSNITKFLNIIDVVATGDEILDRDTAAIEKYRSHPSVMLIKSHYEQVEAFSFLRTSAVEVLEHVDNITSILRMPRLLVVFRQRLLKTRK